MDKPEVVLAKVKEFAAQHPDKTHLVWGCADVYAQVISEIQNDLPENCVTLYIQPDLRDKLESKLSFYEMCDKYGIPYPKRLWCALASGNRAWPRPTLPRRKSVSNIPSS